MSEKYIGIDIGGTSARVAVFAGLDTDTVDRQDRFSVGGDYGQDVRQLVETIKKVSGGAPAAVGVGIAGEFDARRGRLARSPHLKEWVDQPLRDDLAKALDCPVVLINDAEAAAWAETGFGGHKQDFWFITWGTGIGGSIVEMRSDGPHVTKAEPGHHRIRWDETSPRCACGRHGCLEAYVGGTSIRERFGKPAAELSDEEWKDVTDWFARGLYNVIRVRPVPEEVVFGGGVTIKQSRHLPEIERKANEYLKGVVTIRVRQATHGEDAGMVGALASLRQD